MLKTHVERRALREVSLLSAASGHENARFMPKRQFNRLVENIRRDGVLTSAPLIGQSVDEPGRWYVLSGNHRVEAALAAGLTEADCIVITEPLTTQQFVALQLSHNAIEGEDDPAILRKLYDLLDLDLKEYSGVTDDQFDLDQLNVKTLPSATLRYLEVVFAFLGDEADAILEFVKRAERYAKHQQPVLVTQYADFDLLIDSLTAVKEYRNIKNSAVGLRVLCELAMKQITVERAADERP
ncbi:MAG: hypothetical protein QG599_1231 [Pseudomonadota bacterium]|nr:hypothetical protein [Pseudomonadota bacterium]